MVDIFHVLPLKATLPQVTMTLVLPHAVLHADQRMAMQNLLHPLAELVTANQNPLHVVQLRVTQNLKLLPVVLHAELVETINRNDP